MLSISSWRSQLTFGKWPMSAKQSASVTRLKSYRIWTLKKMHLKCCYSKQSNSTCQRWECPVNLDSTWLYCQSIKQFSLNGWGTSSKFSLSFFTIEEQLVNFLRQQAWKSPIWTQKLITKDWTPWTSKTNLENFHWLSSLMSVHWGVLNAKRQVLAWCSSWHSSLRPIDSTSKLWAQLAYSQRDVLGLRHSQRILSIWQIKRRESKIWQD